MATILLNRSKQTLFRWFFYRSRGDSPFIKGIIHLALILVSIIMIYPALRVVTISLRPGNRVLSTSLDVIPTDRVYIPQTMDEAQLHLTRERSPEDAQRRINNQIRGEAVERQVTYRYSGRTATFRTPKVFTDLQLEAQMYLNESDVQDLMDVELAKSVQFITGEFRFESREPMVLNLPRGTTLDEIMPTILTQLRENEYNRRAEGLKASFWLDGQEVSKDLSIPENLGVRDIERAMLYAKSNAKQVAFFTATPHNYGAVFFESDFILWIWNSLLITMSTAFLGVSLASTSAYAFSRFTFKGRRSGLVFLLATQMIPSAMLMLPIYLIATNLKLIGSWVGLVVAYSVGSIPFSIWILKGYYDTIPKELEEAATIDGATKLQTFFKIMLPLAAPALAIVFLFNFMQSWNDFLLARIMLLQDVTRHTWPLGLQRLQGQFTTDWGKFSAAALMVSIPVVILFLSSSKYLVSGLTLGSVKG